MVYRLKAGNFHRLKLGVSHHITRAGTATPTTLRLWLHYVGAHAAGITTPPPLWQDARLRKNTEQLAGSEAVSCGYPHGMDEVIRAFPVGSQNIIAGVWG